MTEYYRAMSSSQHFESNLRRLREERGLTQAALADAARLEMPTVYQYEAGKRRPKIGDSLDALALALGVEPWELLAPPGIKASRSPTAQEAIAVLAKAHGLEVAPSKKSTARPRNP